MKLLEFSGKFDLEELLPVTKKLGFKLNATGKNLYLFTTDGSGISAEEIAKHFPKCMIKTVENTLIFVEKTTKY